MKSSMQNCYGPMDAAPGLPDDYGDDDQSSYQGVPGHGSPMHPGFDANSLNLSKRTSSKHRSIKREKAPTYKGGRGGADGSM